MGHKLLVLVETEQSFLGSLCTGEIINSILFFEGEELVYYNSQLGDIISIRANPLI